MESFNKLRDLGFSQYEISCYLALLAHHPSNGSQLSKFSGISRSRVYDVLRKMVKKGLVLEISTGQYVPLPPDELIKKLRRDFESNLSTLKKQLIQVSQDITYEYIWTMKGYSEVIKKAVEMISSAKEELYIRLFPEEGNLLEAELQNANSRGVNIKYISMGDISLSYKLQVIHPEADHLIEKIGGRSFDIISDKAEALVGIFEIGNEETSPINWTRNHWFIVTNRDSLRHDFFHYFLEKIYDRNEPLTDREKIIYQYIKSDR